MENDILRGMNEEGNDQGPGEGNREEKGCGILDGIEEGRRTDQMDKQIN